MKKKKLSGKLWLNKETISKLKMSKAKGGISTLPCHTMPGVCITILGADC